MSVPMGVIVHHFRLSFFFNFILLIIIEEKLFLFSLIIILFIENKDFVKKER